MFNVGDTVKLTDKGVRELTDAAGLTEVDTYGEGTVKVVLGEEGNKLYGVEFVDGDAEAQLLGLLFIGTVGLPMLVDEIEHA